MLYAIALLAVALIGFFVFSSGKKNKCGCCNTKTADKPPFRTEDSLEKYDKPADGNRSVVDFDDAE